VADERLRADLIALYAFEAELMAIPSRVTQPPLAEMRYAWWREQMDGVFASLVGEGVARKGHPVLDALTDIVGRHGLDRAPFDALIEAHVGRIHGQPHDLDAFYVGPMQVAARLLSKAADPASVVAAARIRGLVQTGRTPEAAARTEANRALRELPAEAFPAVAPAALRSAGPADAARRLRLTWAVLRGRI